MAGFAEQINALAARVGSECKTLRTKVGDLTTLSTTDKTSVVKAISEVKTATNKLEEVLSETGEYVASVEKNVDSNKSDVSVLKEQVSALQKFEVSVGDTETDFVEAFEAALNTGNMKHV